MKTQNWMVSDTVNKQANIAEYYKATMPRLSERRIIALDNLRTMDSKEVAAIWAGIPSEYKEHKTHSLGCA